MKQACSRPDLGPGARPGPSLLCAEPLSGLTPNNAVPDQEVRDDRRPGLGTTRYDSGPEIRREQRGKEAGSCPTGSFRGFVHYSRRIEGENTMHWITRTAATAVTTLALAVPAVGMAQAGAAPAPSSASVTAAASCRYEVVRDYASVRVFPREGAQVLKYKRAGERVTGACEEHEAGGILWTRVNLAGGGHGWMERGELREV